MYFRVETNRDLRTWKDPTLTTDSSAPATGALDPFSYVKPQEAAAILADFILTFYSGVLGLTDGPDSYGLRHKVRTGLQLAAASGSHCAWDAIEAIDSPGGDNAEELEVILESRTTNALFALAVGRSSRPRRLSEAIALIEGGAYTIPTPAPSLLPDQYADEHSFGIAIGRLIAELVKATLMSPTTTGAEEASPCNPTT